LVTLKQKLWFAVEAKLGQGDISPHLRYFGERLGIPFLYQAVAEGRRDALTNGVRVVPAARFLDAFA